MTSDTQPTQPTQGGDAAGEERMSMTLTPRQSELVAHLRSHREMFGRGPTLREMREGWAGYSSGVYDMLIYLERLGAVKTGEPLRVGRCSSVTWESTTRAALSPSPAQTPQQEEA